MDHILGRGRTGTVWLAVHLGLEEYRAIKCIPRDQADYQAFRREALILKSLRHPAIPIVYDLEEDQDYFYIIEEYLQGDSLYALVTDQGVLQETEAVRYGLQLCRLVEFLHSAGDQPILFLDLQPNNLMICQGTLKMVDFGQARLQGNCALMSRRHGTRGWAAPEQYTMDQTLDVRTDIYAIGGVLRYMTSGTADQNREEEETDPERNPLSPRLRNIIRICMEKEKEKRFQTVRELEHCLEAMLDGPVWKGGRTEIYPPSLAIALTGSSPGTGTTHLGLGLCGYLSRRGYACLYVERNTSGHIRSLARQLGLRADAWGIFRTEGCRIRPWYGETIDLPRWKAQIEIIDYGPEWELLKQEWLKRENRAETSQVLLMTAGGNLWQSGEWQRMLEALLPVLEPEGGAQERGTAGFLVFRTLADQIRGLLIKKLGKGPVRVFQMPEFQDPWRPGEAGTEFFHELWKALDGQGNPKGKEGHGWLGCIGKKIRERLGV